MTYISSVGESQIENGCVDLANFAKNKIRAELPTDEQGSRTGRQALGQEQELRGDPEAGAQIKPQDLLEKGFQHFEVNLPNSRSRPPVPAVLRTAAVH